MSAEEQIEVLYNSCYGGWNISEKAYELYKLRNPNIDSNETEFDCNRSDPILIEIYKELGKEFDGKYSETKITKISKKYKNYYYIKEYDGNELVMINYTKYNFDNMYNKIIEILNNDNNNDEKISEIKKFMLTFTSINI